MRLVGKIAIATGAGSGFGEGIANVFTHEDARVIVDNLNAEASKCIAGVICMAGGDTHFVQADVSNGDSVVKLLGATLARYGDLHIAANNTGTTHKNKPLLQITEDEFGHIMAVNVKSIYWTVHHVIPHFRECGNGVFVNVASTAGIRSWPGFIWYNASKGTVIIAGKTMAAELGPGKIRVNCASLVISAMGLIEQPTGVPDTPENRMCLLATIPMGRLSAPRDVANAYLYLVSNEAEFITDACLGVDGGCRVQTLPAGVLARPSERYRVP